MKVFDGQKVIRLGSRLGSGADGTVYRVEGDDAACIKIFDKGTRSRLIENLPRIRALVKIAGSLGHDAAIPTHLVAETPGGTPVGFGMKRVEGNEVHNLYGVSSRQIHFPGVDFRFLLQVAKNAAVATEKLHRNRVVIGDISGRNLMVRKDATVCWIDADSFLVGDPEFRDVCRLVTPEWTPPELQRDRHLTTPRSPGHDVFGLAVMIFHILMLGRHPYQGRFTGAGEAPDLPMNIGNRWYAHANYSAIPLRSPIGTPPVSHLGPAIEQLFLKAFLEESADRRPTSSAWVEALTKLESSMRRCQSSTAHYFSSAASRCPWCQVLPEYGHMDPFQGVAIPAIGGGRPAAAGIVATEIAALISSLAPPTSIPNTVYRPTEGTVAATWSYSKPGWFSALLSSAGSERKKILSAKARFEAIASKIEAEKVQNLRLQQDWLSRIGGVSRKFVELQSEVGGAFAERKLRNEAKKLLEAPQLDQARRNHLAKFRIGVGVIPGIGQKRVSELAGHGITTAADIVKQRIWSIPGFGVSLADSLMDWRRSKERSFRPGPVSVAAAQIEQRARQLIMEKKGPYVSKREPLVRELTRLIGSATACAGQAAEIQRKLDAAKANVTAADNALRGLV